MDRGAWWAPWGQKESDITEVTKYTHPKGHSCCSLEENMFHLKNVLNVSPLGKAIQKQESE